MSPTYHFPVQIYYEDTDHSGLVYHPNYLKYFERAREHAIGPQLLIDLWHQEGIGFAVYRVEIGFAEGAIFGDILDIRSRYEWGESKYRMMWHQEAWRPGGKKAACSAKVEMICINQHKQLLPIPLEKLNLGEL